MAYDVKLDALEKGLPSGPAHDLANEMSLEELAEFSRTGEHPSYMFSDEERQFAIEFAKLHLEIRTGQKINKPNVDAAKIAHSFALSALGAAVLATVIALAVLVAENFLR